jgi:hypothetical protein
MPLVFRTRCVVLVALAAWLAAPVYGCKYDPDRVDKRPLAERLNEVPVAFIGTVSSITPDGMVQFHVEHLLRGNTDGARFLVKVGRSDCDLGFSVGQRWLYGGTTIFHPSVLLAGPGESGPTLTRLGDSRLTFPPEWQACDSDAQCSVLPYGCTSTAVNKRFLPAATERAWRIGGDPRAVKCLPQYAPAFEPVLCKQGKCGVWRLQGVP